MSAEENYYFPHEVLLSKKTHDWEGKDIMDYYKSFHGLFLSNHPLLYQYQ